MAGCITGFYGFQRSGKTLMAYLVANLYAKKFGLPVYTNMSVPGWNQIDSLKSLPLDFQPKILLLDEVYYFMDSRNWKDNTSSSIFFNTIGKQNILLLLTAVNPDSVEKRLRDQHNYMFIVKSDEFCIYYKILDVQRNTSSVFVLKKSKDLFQKLTYDTLQVPDYVDCDLSFLKSKSLSNKNNIYI